MWIVLFVFVIVFLLSAKLQSIYVADTDTVTHEKFAKIKRMDCIIVKFSLTSFL